MNKVYTKHLLLLLLPFLLLIGCEEEETWRNDPPKVAFSVADEDLLGIDLDKGVGPRIQGTVQSDAGLEEVVLEIITTSGREVVETVTTFDEITARVFVIDFLPEYTPEVVGFRVLATDVEGRSAGGALTISAIGGAEGPVISLPSGTVNANIRESVNERPAIEGTVSSHWGLQSINYFAVYEGDVEEDAGEITDFGETPNTYSVNVTPEYRLGMTGFKVIAVDMRGNASEYTVPITVIDAGRAPITAFNQESVEANLKTSPSIEPEVSGTIISEEGLVSVSYYLVKADGDEQFGETVTTFTNPNEFDFTLQPPYAFGVTGIKVVAEDAVGQEVSEVLPVTVIANDPALAVYSNINLWATGARSSQPSAFSVATGETYVYDQEPVTDEGIASSVHFIAVAPDGSAASYDVMAPTVSWLDNNYFKDVVWPVRNATQMRLLEEGEINFEEATSAEINALELGETTDRVRAIQDSDSKTILFETEGGNRGLIYYVGSDEALSKNDKMTFSVKYVKE